MIDINPELKTRLIAEGVDLDRMVRFLEDLNAGKYDNSIDFVPESVPDMTNPAIVDRRGPASVSLDLDAARARFREIGLDLDPAKVGALSALPAASASTTSASASSPSIVTFNEQALETIGVHLYPKAAYGVLNGGSASSYADVKKNRAIDPDLFATYSTQFETLASECRGQPKGITPAYINPDGTPGYSFLLLKLRMVLEHKKRYADLTGHSAEQVLPFFQMTSVHTDRAIDAAFREYLCTPELKDFADSLGISSIELFTETQTMMAAITHSSEGSPRKIFDRAFGNQNTPIAMPGGHGQNFEILAPVYRKLLAQGVRYAWLGNIDNMGFTVDPVSLALFALSGRDAAFELSWRTPMDVKGGILVAGKDGKLTCADIGPAISAEDVRAFEDAGKPILFNCGLGLFDLAKLVPMLDELPYKLPLRVTDQDKDSGKYAQAEQITWEIIALLEKPLFFAVEKSRRFIAAKMLMETILTSLPPSGAGDLARVSKELNRGLSDLLSHEYALTLSEGRWRPVS